MLQELGKKFNTDKASHVINGKSYLNIYEQYFKEIKTNKLNFLEIGVRDGCSVKMWKEYFLNSNIVGLDIDPRCKQHEEERIKIIIGSQSDPDTILKCENSIEGHFDIIMDDGSHINELTIASFNLLFEQLNSGGYYIIEDLGNSYFEDIHRHIVVGGWPGMHYNKNVIFTNKRQDIDTLFNGLIKNMDLAADLPNQYNSKIEYIHFHPRIIVIKKI